MYKHRLFQWCSEEQKANRNNFHKNWDDSHFCVTSDLYLAYRPFMQTNGIVQKITEEQVLYQITSLFLKIISLQGLPSLAYWAVEVCCQKYINKWKWALGKYTTGEGPGVPLRDLLLLDNPWLQFIYGTAVLQLHFSMVKKIYSTQSHAMSPLIKCGFTVLDNPQQLKYHRVCYINACSGLLHIPK